MRHVLLSVYAFDLVESFYIRRESSMQTEDLTFNYCRDWKTMEEFSEKFPNLLWAVFPETLIVKAVLLVDLPVLMVPPQQSDPVAVFDLQQQHIKKCLHTVESTIHIVSHKKIVGALHNKNLTGSLPEISKISSRSKNCPWVSPQTVTGARTLTRLGSARRISFAWNHYMSTFSQIVLTSFSGITSSFSRVER